LTLGVKGRKERLLPHSGAKPIAGCALKQKSHERKRRYPSVLTFVALIFYVYLSICQCFGRFEQLVVINLLKKFFYTKTWLLSMKNNGSLDRKK
jgi:hypothetical protein